MNTPSVNQFQFYDTETSGVNTKLDQIHFAQKFIDDIELDLNSENEKYPTPHTADTLESATALKSFKHLDLKKIGNKVPNSSDILINGIMSES